MGKLRWILAISIVLLGSTVPVVMVSGTPSPPVVTAVSPNSGPLEGTVQVEIQGSGFFCGQSHADPALAVDFGSTPVVNRSTSLIGDPYISLITNSEILVTAPAATAPGAVNIVVSTTSCGSSAQTLNDVFFYQGQCSGSCTLQVNGTQTLGTAAGLASGILEGSNGSFADATAVKKVVAYLNALDITHWRIDNSSAGVTDVYDSLTNKPKLEYLLSDGYLAVGGGAPWSDSYANWNTYLKDMATGQTWCDSGCWAAPPGPVYVWDAWNEPSSTIGQIEGTPAEWYALFADTYLTLSKYQTDPQVVIPSMQTMLDWSLASSGSLSQQTYISFKDMFNWITAWNANPANTPLHFAGYAFHASGQGQTCDNYAVPGCPEYPLNTPDLVGDQVNRLRNLLAQYPSLEPAQIIVDEFGSGTTYNELGQAIPGDQLMPGWQVGFISAFEQSNVSFAGLACWPVYYGALNLNMYNECNKGFDGLFVDDNNPSAPNTLDDNVTPQAIYWVYAFYGSMTGLTRVEATAVNSTTAYDLSAFATRNDSNDTMRILVGRHNQCSSDTNRDPVCPAVGQPESVTLQITWPYAGSSFSYSLQHIPDIGNGLGGAEASLPTAVTGVAQLQNGVGSVTIPSFADGDAYTLVLTPNSGAAQGPPKGRFP
jgi:hypothetical protein